MFRFLILFTALVFLTACGQSGKSPESTETPAPVADAVSYPSVPLDTLTMLWEKCDYIDYIFYGLNFSVNQSEKPAVQNALSHISEEVPQINPTCRPAGHIFYQVAGENRLEADFYFQPECIYFVFYEDGKPAFANKMTPAGLQFYQTIIERVNASRQGQ